MYFRYLNLTVFIVTFINACIFPIPYVVCFLLTGRCMFWMVSSFFLLLYHSSAKLRALHFPILKVEEVCIPKTRKECSVQCALTHNGLAAIISECCNSPKYSLTKQIGIITVEMPQQGQNTHLKERYLHSDTLLCIVL